MSFKRLIGTFRARIFLTYLAALLPVVVVLSSSVEWYFVPSVTTQTKLDLSNSTRTLANAVRAGAAVAIRNHLKAIAERNRDIVRQHLDLVDQGLLTRQEARDRVSSILLSQQVGTSGYIYCLNSQGWVTVHPNPGVQDTDVSSFGFVQEQLAQKEGYIEYDWRNPGETATRPKALYMVYVEELDWIISVSSYRAEFNELLDPEDLRDVVLSMRFGETGYAYLVARDGEVLVHPKLSNFNILLQDELPTDFFKTMLAAGQGSLEYEWRNPGETRARQKIAAFDYLPAYGWVVASSAYLDEIMAPARLARTIAHGSALLLLLAGGLATYFLSGRLSRPVDEMVRQLDLNARSGVHAPLPVLADDEIGRLAGEFNAFLEVIRKQHADIQRERGRYQGLFEASPDAIILMHDLHITACNPATMAMLDGDQDEIIGRTVIDLSPEFQPDGEGSADKAARLLRRLGDENMVSFEWVNQTMEGRPFDSEVRLMQFGQDESESLQLAFVRDITERKRVLDALSRSEEKYRQLIETANDAIFIAQDQRLVFANSKTAELSGYDVAELMEISIGDIIHPDDLSMVIDRHQRRIKGETDLPSTYSYRIITKNGAERTGQLSVAQVDWNGRPATLSFMRDITEQLQMEKVLQQAQKMEAIGTLAGGIAHDFNNLMLGIQGRASLMAQELSAEHDFREHIDAIEEHVASATTLTRQLLGVARGGKYRPRPVDLNEMVVDSSTLFGRTRKEIRIETRTASEPLVVEADRQQLDQVLLNLYINAWQAMPGGGSLHLETSVTTLDVEFCAPHDARPGRYARISVTDRGVGMDETTARQVFDPFFTTKDKGRGTGLGLASAYGIIKNHGGFITVYSEVDHGSTFNIYLPVSDKAVAPEQPVRKEVVSGTERVLLVDDEPMILEVGKVMLEKLGYQVVVAEGGEQAVAAATESEAVFDLVILDMIMPGLDGSQTYDRIHAAQPALPVILSSGYSLDGKAAEIMQRGCRGFIQKPFNLAELSLEIRKALDGAGDGAEV